MPTKVEFYSYECQNCNYEATLRSAKMNKMIDRLHSKKCSKTGRTEIATVEASVDKKLKILSGISTKIASGNEEECGASVVSVEKAKKRQKKRMAEVLRKFKAEAENSPEEGERGEPVY